MQIRFWVIDKYVNLYCIYDMWRFNYGIVVLSGPGGCKDDGDGAW